MAGGWGAFLGQNLTFSKLFGSCFKIDWKLFLDLKSPYIAYRKTLSVRLVFGGGYFKLKNQSLIKMLSFEV